MSNSNSTYWKEHEAKISAAVSGPRTRKPSKKVRESSANTDGISPPPISQQDPPSAAQPPVIKRKSKDKSRQEQPKKKKQHKSDRTDSDVLIVKSVSNNSAEGSIAVLKTHHDSTKESTVGIGSEYSTNNCQATPRSGRENELSAVAGGTTPELNASKQTESGATGNNDVSGETEVTSGEGKELMDEPLPSTGKKYK